MPTQAGRPTVPRRPRRKRVGTYHHGGLREAAVMAALAALDRGASLPSLRELATACGVAHPALYRHFASAEELMLSVAAACFREFHTHIADAFAQSRTPEARLRAGCKANIRWGLAHPERYALMTGPDLAGKQHHAEFLAAAKAAFDSLVDAVRHCGVPEPVPVAHTMMCAMHGLIDFARKGRTIPHQAASLDAQIDAMLTLVGNYARDERSMATSSQLTARSAVRARR